MSIKVMIALICNSIALSSVLTVLTIALNRLLFRSEIVDAPSPLFAIVSMTTAILYWFAIFFLDIVLPRDSHMMLAIIAITALMSTVWSDTIFLLIHRLWSIVAGAVVYGFLFLTQDTFVLLDATIAIFYGMISLALVRVITSKWLGQESMGQGDAELMLLIGASTGLWGTWFTITVGSLLGILIAYTPYFYKKPPISHIPFGACMSVVAIVYLLVHYAASSVTRVIFPV